MFLITKTAIKAMSSISINPPQTGLRATQGVGALEGALLFW